MEADIIPYNRVNTFFDFIDRIDRRIYNYRSRLLIWASFLVLIVAPLLDDFAIKDYEDTATHVANWLFIMLLLFLILSFMSSWRNEKGLWTWKESWVRTKTYFKLFGESLYRYGKRTKAENVYRFGWFLFFAGIVLKASQNISVFIRKPLEHLTNMRFDALRTYERDVKEDYILIILFGVLIFALLLWQRPDLFNKKIKNDLLHIIGLYRKPYSAGVVSTTGIKNLIINSKNRDHVNSTVSACTSHLLRDFLIATRDWENRYESYECVYQMRFIKHLKNRLPNVLIESESWIKDRKTGRWIRADIVINKTILIEMKRDSSAGAVQRAKGQIYQYSELWQGKGPVVLLLCDYDFGQAQSSYAPLMKDLTELKRQAMTVIALPKTI